MPIMLPVVKFKSAGPGKGSLTINDVPIPMLESVNISAAVNKPTVCTIKFFCQSVEIEAPSDEIEMVAQAQQPIKEAANAPTGTEA